MTATTTADATTTMDVLLDQGDYKHLSFRRRSTEWEVLTFPGGFHVRRFAGRDFVFVNGAADMPASLAFTGPDPGYWADKLTAGTPKSWCESDFSEWLVEEARDVLGLEYAEIDDLLKGADLSTEARSREVVQEDFKGVDFPAPTTFYTWDDRFLMSLSAAHRGLALYADRQS
ncbi:hypothetical protein [Nocardiopsis tropica]|uniref:Uncharacterized protein n=1 Tax=Nocardiopsis tropica TaxID=109330 RepID=A0ABV2A4R9_9ACTN